MTEFADPQDRKLPPKVRQSPADAHLPQPQTGPNPYAPGPGNAYPSEPANPYAAPNMPGASYPGPGYPGSGYPGPTRDLGDDPTMRMLLPVGTSGWAIAAGYLGLFSVLCLPGPLAIIAGLVAIQQIRNNPKKHGIGRAIFVIFLCALGTLGLLLMVVSMILNA